MNKTKIEWCDYTVNPVKGYCPMACPYCYARRMYDRFHWDKTIRWDSSVFHKGGKIPEGSKIFWGSTIELFGEWVKESWIRTLMETVREYKNYTHIFLTKQPQNLRKYSPFPGNCWIGATATDEKSMAWAANWMPQVEAKVKFVSFEPLHGDVNGALWPEPSKATANTFTPHWAILGAETGNRKGKPPLEQVQNWAREIIWAADEASIPVFTKDNLKLPANDVRREWPR